MSVIFGRDLIFVQKHSFSEYERESFLTDDLDNPYAKKTSMESYHKVNLQDSISAWSFDKISH